MNLRNWLLLGSSLIITILGAAGTVGVAIEILSDKDESEDKNKKQEKID